MARKRRRTVLDSPFSLEGVLCVWLDLSSVPLSEEPEPLSVEPTWRLSLLGRVSAWVSSAFGVGQPQLNWKLWAPQERYPSLVRVGTQRIGRVMESRDFSPRD